ncbi:MAG TPA: hypothetical protein VG367_17760 [Mucilaginibacter sp.]|jgi:hypothetical protein|nr:hypothetical protein [Mucilaginibacter sp.]
MAEKIVSVITTSKNQVLRVRELNFTEYLSSGYKFIIEILDQGTFKKIKEPYFNTQNEANDVIDKIYNLDNLLIRKKKAIEKLQDDFESSIEGSEEYDFYQIFDGLWINDFDIRSNEHSRAITASDVDRNVIDFLKKYKFPTSFKGIYIIDYHVNYSVMLRGYDKEYCIFSTDWLVNEKPNGEQYLLLFERYLSVTFSKFI